MQSPDAAEKDPAALTQWAKATGCSCKIAPAQLQEMLASSLPAMPPAALLVGNSSNDDAAVYALDDTTALIATTDFFTPVVDDAFDYGRIAAANALSDVYAMGGRPVMALAVLGWPVDALPAAQAQRVLEGARATCAEAGIPLAGGHSIITAEPFFGLSVNGLVAISNLRRNDTAREGDLLFLTKPIGSGILTTAAKRGILPAEHYSALIGRLSQLNKIGATLGSLPGVTAMTDVTGFGLLGHLIEVAEGSGLSAMLDYSAVQIPQVARELAAQRIVPDATFRNWNSYSARTGFAAGVNVAEAFSLLPDPQTNGGLLICVQEDAASAVQELLRQEGYEGFLQPIGKMVGKAEKVVTVVGRER
jgi:selenide,water dikinase